MTDTAENATLAPADEVINETVEEPALVDDVVNETFEESITPVPVPVDKSLNLDENEIKLLTSTVKKYTAYKNRTKSQDLLLTLNAIQNKTKSDISNIRKILAVEKALIDKKATQQKVTAIFRAENLAKRKLDEHKKYKIGGAIEPLRRSGQSMQVLGEQYPNITFHQFIQDLITHGFLVDEVIQKDENGNDIIINTGKFDKNNKPIFTKSKVKYIPYDKQTNLPLFPINEFSTTPTA